MNELCRKMAEILDVEDVTGFSILRDFEEWDSLSVLSTIAMLDASYGVNLTASDLIPVRTVNDLWSLIQSRKSA